MPEENEEKQEGMTSAEEATEKEGGEENIEASTGTNVLDIGIVILFICVLIDIVIIICIPLIFLFGVGLLISKIVSIIGTAILALWAATKKGGIMGFLKKRKVGLFAKIIPIIGEFQFFYFTYTAWKMLKEP